MAGADDVALSVAESNALRARLGLPPLREGAGPAPKRTAPAAAAPPAGEAGGGDLAARVAA
jgi:hypothetical protein